MGRTKVSHLMNTTMSEIHTNHIEMRKDNTMSVQKEMWQITKTTVSS